MKRATQAMILCALLAITVPCDAVGQSVHLTPAKVLSIKGNSICKDRSREPDENRKAYEAVEASLRADGMNPSNYFMTVVDDVSFDDPKYSVTVFVRGECGKGPMKYGGQFFVVNKKGWWTDGGLPPDISYMAPHWIKSNGKWILERGYFEH